jgi:uncharacterized protein (TIGR02246 family)
MKALRNFRPDLRACELEDRLLPVTPNLGATVLTTGGNVQGIRLKCSGKETSMRRALVLACLTAALLSQGLVVRGQDRAQDVSTVVVALAERESAAFARAFNDRKFKDLAALFTADADLEFLRGPSVEKLEYRMACGRDEIANTMDTFCSTFPSAKLTLTVRSARLIRPDLLIAEAEFEIKGLPRDAGPIQGRAVTVRVLESGVWKIAADRGLARTPVKK